MLSRVLRLIIIFLTYAILFVAGKLIFLLINSGIYTDLSFGSIIDIIFHGFSMDCSMAGYLTAVPALLLGVGIWVKRRWEEKALDAWRYISIFLILCAVGLDAVLYGYWNFKLDTTPVFYFLTSPSAALASVSIWLPISGLLVVALLTWGLGLLFGRLWNIIPIPHLYSRKSRFASVAAIIVCIGILFILIRGGFTVSTMNPSAAYFSTDTKLNHAAVNPLFSFMYSATHSSDFSKQFRYFPEKELSEYIERMNVPADSTGRIDILRIARPDIYLVILESFSSHLLPSFGGEAVAKRLDSIASSGVTFTNFYSSSFRTDRAIPAILSGYPAQPTTSVMKFVDKSEKLPSLAAVLRDSAGYKASYYYGGDINFVNQKAYLVSGGYEKIISDKDFPLSDRLSKWGAHDDKLWQKVYEDIVSDSSPSPKIRVIQTSSSHEPFEVPYSNPTFPDLRANAFAFADSCLGNFVDKLRLSGQWDNSLVLIVPDHWGAYPQGLTDPVERHQIPLILTGGALIPDTPSIIDVPGSQNDIAATLLGQLGIDSSDFSFSRDMLDSTRQHFAFFSEPDFAALITPSDTTVISTLDESVIYGSKQRAVYPKAYLQYLYKDLDAR